MAEITPLLRTSGHTCQGNGLRTAHSGSHCAHFIAVAPLMKTTLGDAQHKSQHWMSGNRPRSAQEKAGVQRMGRARGVLTSSFTSLCVPQGGSWATRHTLQAAVKRQPNVVVPHTKLKTASKKIKILKKWPWKLDPRNGHCATPSQWSRRKSREISGIVTENTRF